MRIISDNKDYYDCVQGMGQDLTLVYVRKAERIDLKPNRYPFSKTDWPFPAFYWGYGGSPEIILHVIGFCGKIYPMFELYKRGERDKSAKCYNIEEIDKFMKSYLKPKDFKRYTTDKYTGWWWGIESRKGYIRLLREFTEKQESFRLMFEDKKCPIFLGSLRDNGTSITYNANLKWTEFIRVFDPYTAFQEISMFLGGMAMPEKEMPVISDELKIYSRGFDKWSFRRRPGGR